MLSLDKLEDTVIADLEKEMINDIDREVWQNLLKDWEHEQAAAERDWMQQISERNWHFVKVSKDTDNDHALDMLGWCREHCQGQYESYGPEFIFENDKDAVMFILKWV